MSENEKHQKNQSPAEESRRQPVFLLPGAVTVLCGVLIAVHLARTFILNEDGSAQFLAWFGFIPFRVLAGDGADGGWLPLLWTPITHAFVHAGWDHLLVNVAWLAIFATPVAGRYGGFGMTVIFLGSAVAGAAAFAATTLPDLQVLIGASGGVAGLTGAAIRFMFQPLVVARNPETGEHRVLGRHLASLRELTKDPRARAFILVWVVLNAAVPLLPLLTGSAVGVAWQAHLGGFFAGLALAPLFERRQSGAPAA